MNNKENKKRDYGTRNLLPDDILGSIINDIFAILKTTSENCRNGSQAENKKLIKKQRADLLDKLKQIGQDYWMHDIYQYDLIEALKEYITNYSFYIINHE